MKNHLLGIIYILFVTPWSILSETNPIDLQVLKDFKEGIENSELLGWPDASEDPCGDQWEHVFCKGTRVSQIQVKEMGLKGTLTLGLSSLTMLSNIGLQRNNFTGPLPSFRGLANLQYAFLDYNHFDSIPLDFFDGLDSIQTLALDGNHFNSTDGWMFPVGLQGSLQLSSLSCMDCNLVGPLPEFLGKMPSLVSLKLSGNSLSGQIPSSFEGAALRDLWLNNQNNGGLTGPIDLVATMTGLSTLWLHGNQFTGSIPAGIGDLSLLKDLNLNGNKLVGLIPDSLAGLPLENLDLNNNRFMGPIPVFKAKKVSFASNSFCVSKPGDACDGEVMSLIEFLGEVGYPDRLVNSWSGDNPCDSWVGLGCLTGKVASIVLPNMNLTGNLSGSIGNLDALTQIKLQNNSLAGEIPLNWTKLSALKLLDLSNNELSPPVPSFASSVKLNVDGNPLLNGGSVPQSPTSSGNPSVKSPPSAGNPSGKSPASTGSHKSPPTGGSESWNSSSQVKKKEEKKLSLISYAIPLGSTVLLLALLVPMLILCWRKRKGTESPPSSLVIYPQDPSNAGNQVKVVVASNTYANSGSESSALSDCHTIESGNLVISVQVLKKVTSNFSSEKELGRGGFGVVYRGDLEDGTAIAVKRMEAGVLTKKAFDEFQAEIAVLSKVRHRHLVSLLGYSIEGNERILVYEFMPQGALSKHLFHWKRLKLEPLSWKRRLNIALDVARGMEYLHSLAHRSFIHRDLKSSNILLGDDFRAKVSDFGLVKLAPDGEKSVTTRLAGTFGYLAPEYAVTGKITTKADVFSFGVVLMELLTGLMALDGDRPEESQYLASWFWKIRSDEEKLRAAIDATLDAKEETMEGIMAMAELAGHCTAREANQRPDMSHAVNVLGPLVEKWEPLDDETEGYCGIDYSLPLNQMVKGWQEAEGKDLSGSYLEDSKSSIPAKPTGFADSFTSSDGR